MSLKFCPIIGKDYECIPGDLSCDQCQSQVAESWPALTTPPSTKLSNYTQPVEPPASIKEFGTGAKRCDDSDKVNWGLLPVQCLERVAIRYTEGAKHYGANNWKKGVPKTRIYTSTFRHLMEYRAGKTNEDHLAAVVWNVFALMYQEMKAKIPTVLQIEEEEWDE